MAEEDVVEAVVEEEEAVVVEVAVEEEEAESQIEAVAKGTKVKLIDENCLVHWVAQKVPSFVRKHCNSKMVAPSPLESNLFVAK